MSYPALQKPGFKVIFVSATYPLPFETSNYLSVRASNRQKTETLLSSHEPEAESLRNLRALASTRDGFLQPRAAVLKNGDISLLLQPSAAIAAPPQPGSSPLGSKFEIHVGKGHLPPKKAPGARGETLTLLCLQTYHREELMEKRVQAV